MDKERKSAIIGGFKTHDGDSGSAEVQIALLTERVNELTSHLKAHPHDYHSQRGLFGLIGHRRRLLGYLSRTNLKSYRAVIDKLGLRK